MFISLLNSNEFTSQFAGAPCLPMGYVVNMFKIIDSVLFSSTFR